MLDALLEFLIIWLISHVTMVFIGTIIYSLIDKKGKK